KFGGETPTDAMEYLPCLRARPRLEAAGAHLSAFHAVLVPRSLSPHGTQHQARLPGTRRDTFCVSVERALPTPARPSPAIAPRAPSYSPEPRPCRTRPGGNPGRAGV